VVDAIGAFVPSGVEGDYTAWGMAPAGCNGNRAPGAVGTCRTFTYNLSPGAGLGMGWLGDVWQYPPNNWFVSPGYAIPAGATKVTFWVRGATGSEVVAFNAGGTGVPTAVDPCVDTVAGSVPKMMLPTTWTQVTINLTGTYAGGVVDAFTWVAVAADQPIGSSSITFYIDDIEWQM
jgi:hypothetical protein